MAEKNFKVNEAIEIIYQAPNAAEGLDIRADIYDEVKALHAVDQPLIEVGNTGTYRRAFTPDAAGEWQAVIYEFIDSDTRNGQVVKRYSVGAHNVDSVGTDMAKDATVAKDSTVAKDNTVAKEATLTGVDDQLDTVETKIDNIVTSVGSLDTPPMVS